MAYMYSPEGAGVGKRGDDQDADIIREFKRKLAEDEGYIAYFNERIRIEQAYIDALTKLHGKTVGVDALHDDVTHRGQRSSARTAYMEVRDYTQREIDSREALVNALREDVVNKLAALRDTQTRIRNRIREDLKTATEAYEDYAFTKVPKLRRSYMVKTSSIEEYRKQELAIQKQQQLLSEPSPSSPQPEKPHPFALPASSSGSVAYSGYAASQYAASSTGHHAASASGSDTPPNVLPTTPTPTPSIPPGINFANQLAAPDQRREKLLTGRARSGSASLASAVADGRSKEVFQDIAAQGKKGFSAIMQRFGGEREGAAPIEPIAIPVEMPSPAKHGHGHVHGHDRQRSSISRSASVAKGAKIKRDASDADKAYREGVFHCESLRLRREKLQQSAITSLMQFNDDLNSTLQVTLRAFTDATHGTAATLAQATEVVSSSLKDIKPAADTMLFRSKLPMPARRAPILYENFYVGPCHSLIFGVSLTDYDFARGEGGDHGRLPLIVEKCLAEIDARGMGAEGIYRLSGRAATVKQLVQDIELDENTFTFKLEDDVYSIGVILKQYLRELPEPLFPLPHAERVKYTEHREALMESSFAPLRGRLRRLPPIHQTTFQAIIEHLARVSSRAKDNKMDAKNLAVLFNAALFGQDQVPATGNALTMHLEKDTVLEDLITYSDLLFSAPSLPESSASTASGARVLTTTPERKGSRHTNVSIGPVPVFKDASPTESNEALSAGQPVLAQPVPVVASTVSAFEFKVTDDSPTSEFTPDTDLTLLYDPAMIPQSMRDIVGEAYHVRPLASDDFLRSHFGLLSNLSTSPPLAPSVYMSLFNALKGCDDTYYITVIVARASDQIVASGTVVKERKFIHGAGQAAHIEDIVVSPTVQGQGLGKKFVMGLLELATASLGCYKTILDCQESKVPFYEKCGFTLRGRQMAYYAPTDELGRTQSVGSMRALTPAAASGDGSTPGSTTPDVDHTAAAELEVPENQDDNESVAETVETSASGVTYHFPVDAFSGLSINTGGSAFGGSLSTGRASSSGTATPSLLRPEGDASTGTAL